MMMIAALDGEVRAGTVVVPSPGVGLRIAESGEVDKISTVTEVTYEDGRKGSIRATLDIRDAKVVAVKPKSLEAAE